MAGKYDAFISYKHTPKDSEIAAHIQKKLERFVIPKSVSNLLGRKRINRVFRDKEELSLTSSLSDTIMQALRVSDNLIVICSKETKKSQWVSREIEFFLKTHSRRKIFAVVVDGEPNDVMPEILLKEEQRLTGTDGNPVIKVIKYEPLACDYRMPLKEADKKELPRLVAGIIGCDYEALVGRIQKYKRQRLTIILSAVFAVVFAFSAYLFYSMNRFKQAYLDSLRNESVMLAGLSQESLMEGERIDAINYALQALPSEELDRPLVPEAVYALSNSVMAYNPNGKHELTPAWNYSVNDVIKRIAVSPDGSMIAALTDIDSVYVWNTDTHETIIEIPSGGYLHTVSEMMYVNDNVLVMAFSSIYGDVIRAYDNAGNELWGIPDYRLDTMDSGISKYDDEHIVVAKKVVSNGSFSDVVIDKINVYTGEVERIFTAPSSNYDTYSLSTFCFSPDKSKILFKCYQCVDEIIENRIFIYDMSSGEFTEEYILPQSTYDIVWITEECICISHKLSNVNNTIPLNDRLTYDISGPNRMEIICIDADTATQIWSTEVEDYGDNPSDTFIVWNSADTFGYCLEDSYREYDIETGEETAFYDATDKIVYTGMEDGDIEFFITETGKLVWLKEQDGLQYLAYSKEFPDDVKSAVGSASSYFILNKDSNEIIEYNTEVCDSSYSVLSNDVSYNGRCGGFLSYDKYSVYMDYLGNPVISINLIDTQTNESTIIYENYEDIGFNMRLLAMNEQYVTFSYIRTSYENNVISYMLILGRVDYTDPEFPCDLVELTDCYAGYTNTDEYICAQNNMQSVLCWNALTGDFCGANVVRDYNFISLDLNTNPIYFPNAGMFLFKVIAGDNYFYFPDEENIILVNLPSDWTETTCYCEAENSDLIAMSDRRNTVVIDSSCEVIAILNMDNKTALAMTFTPDDSSLLILCTDGTLLRYSTNDYETVNSMDAFIYPSVSFDVVNDVVRFSFDEEDQLFMIDVSSDNRMQIIDMSSWGLIGSVLEGHGYNPETNRFYSALYSDRDTYNIICYDRYEMADLINIGHDYLGDEN